MGYDRSPRFHGIDDRGRQILDFLEGDVVEWPAWTSDDGANADELCRLAGLVRELHQATASFDPPPDAKSLRPLPVEGDTWVHGDTGYPNVYRADWVGFIDWEYAGRSDAAYDLAGLIASGVRGPKMGAADLDRRVAAVVAAVEAIATGYEMDQAMLARLPDVTAELYDNATDLRMERGESSDFEVRMRWRANWYRDNASLLAG